MDVFWEMVVYENQKLLRTIPCANSTEFGRQKSPDETLYTSRHFADRCRIVIAGHTAKDIPREYFRVEPLNENQFRLTNLSSTRTVRLHDGQEIPPHEQSQVPSGTLLVWSGLSLRIRALDPLRDVGRLDEATAPPGTAPLIPPGLVEDATLGSRAPEAERLVRWLLTVVRVLESVAGSGDFFDQATQAMVEIAGLDSGAALLWENGDWQEKARFPAASERRVSRNLLRLVQTERRTFFEVPPGPLADAASLRDLGAVVAAPILDRTGEVRGVLYGHRGSGLDRGTITKVEATLAEILARGVAAGLARVEQEKKALAAQILFAQFFSADLAHHLARDPDLLDRGRDAEVSVLFCDIRGFSRISERLTPEDTLNWIRDVLDALSGCVRAHDGVLVDYIGDELLAMWGAPAAQPDHAARACRAGLAMMGCLTEVNARWQPRLGEPTAIGIGINSGKARVGNTGSKFKYKYGPLGNTVNLASRVQGATKQVKCRFLITGATAAALDGSFVHRRLCQVRVINIKAPVDLHELAPADQPAWADACEHYQLALADFERKRFRDAAHRLAELRGRRPDDGPALVLLSRAVQCMVAESDPFDPVWELSAK